VSENIPSFAADSGGGMLPVTDILEVAAAFPTKLGT
jgi:hypothetical protein